MIDTHVHQWEIGRFRYLWLADAAFDDLRKDYFPADYRADAAEVPVDSWVHIQAEVDHQLDPVAETAWVDSLAEVASAAGLPGPLACVVYADLRAANVRDLLSRHCSYPLTRGVRHEDRWRVAAQIVDGFAQLNDNAATLFGAPTEGLRT